MKNSLYILLLTVTSLLSAIDLPDREGFSWWEIESIKGAILVPDGWHTRSVRQNDALGFFVTKESTKTEEGTFQTGLSLNVFRDFETKHKMNPIVFVDEFRTKYGDQGAILKESAQEMGPFQSYSFLTQSIVENVPTTINHLFVLNPQTGTLYYYFFEAPTLGFEEAWQTGEIIMQQLLIDDTI